MNWTKFASSILLSSCFFMLAACDSLGLPNVIGHDEVPDEVKEQPLLVERAPALSRRDAWPRLGDVPAKPKDFSSKNDYDQDMNELEDSRNEALLAKKEALESDPVVGSGGVNVARPEPILRPPQLPHQLK